MGIFGKFWPQNGIPWRLDSSVTYHFSAMSIGASTHDSSLANSGLAPHLCCQCLRPSEAHSLQPLSNLLSFHSPKFPSTPILFWRDKWRKSNSLFVNKATWALNNISPDFFFLFVRSNLNKTSHSTIKHHHRCLLPPNKDKSPLKCLWHRPQGQMAAVATY